VALDGEPSTGTPSACIRCTRSYATEWCSPQPTTVRRPMRDDGRLALCTLLSMSQGEPLEAS
jgi:hypothetical protein